MTRITSRQKQEEESRCPRDINITIRSLKEVESLASSEGLHMRDECMLNNNRKNSVRKRFKEMQEVDDVLRRQQQEQGAQTSACSSRQKSYRTLRVADSLLLFCRW